MVLQMYGRKWSVSGARASLWLDREFPRQLKEDLTAMIEVRFECKVGISYQVSGSRRGFVCVVMTNVQLDRRALNEYVCGYIFSRFAEHNIRIVYCRSRHL